MNRVQPSEQDIEFLSMIRSNVREFMRRVGQQYANRPGRLLDIAPQVHEGARPYFPPYITVETFDIDPSAGCTYTGDICRTNEFIPENTFDFVVCTEVLEHTLNPWAAVQEIWRILQPGGMLFCSTPFNFRIHGPLPDCWRFTEHGLRALLARFEIIELKALETPGRPLMPIHYTVVARKPEVPLSGRS
jgi:SAM-dependent methyltransferase